MAHTYVLSIFMDNFTHYQPLVKEWFPNGKDSVRVRLHDNRELIFTYHNEQDWTLETRRSFLNRTKG